MFVKGVLFYSDLEKKHMCVNSSFSYARYIIDMQDHPPLAEGRFRSVEVKASFFAASSEESSVSQIRLAAFSQEPGEVRPIWNDQETLFNTALQHVAAHEHAGNRCR